MERFTRQAPAKINLALDILGRRTDGYHEMRMVMQTVSLCDTVTLEQTGGGFTLNAGGILLPGGKKSLEQRAAESFFTAIGREPPGLTVTLEKRTPAYAGMGGGSADVAALLRLLRRCYAPEMTTLELERIGLEVGSDVPFCVRGGTCLAEGRGEILTDLPPLPDCAIVLCKPGFDLPTPSLFARLEGAILSARPDIPGMETALFQGSLTGVAGRLGNVFEQVLTENERQEIQYIKESLLRCGALGAAMSGSGPTVFGLFDDPERAAWGKELLERRYRQTYLAQPVKKFGEME